MLKGIDISTYQKPHLIDYEKLAKEIDFAILRVGYTGWGTGVSYHSDKEFEAHYKALTALKVPIGVYWYSCANTPDKARAEARETIKRIKGLKIEYPVYWDTEDIHYQKPTSVKTLTATAKAYCKEIEKAGYYVGIYASVSWLKRKLDMNELKDYDVWLAHYGVKKPNYDLPYGMWQYSSYGRINGYKRNLDMNIAYKDYKKIIAEAGLNNLVATPKPKTIKELAQEVLDGKHGNGVEREKSLGTKYDKVQKEVNRIMAENEKPKDKIHTVVEGDNLSSIAKQYDTSWQKVYWDNKEAIGDNADLIKAGTKLVIK